MRRRISTQTIAAVKLFRIRYFPNVSRDGSLNTKVPWLWIICFLVIIIITSYNTPFFTDSSLSYLHQALHFPSSHYKVSPCSFLHFLHHLSSLFSYLFSLSLFMSPLYIWGTKCRTYRLSVKEDVVLGYRLLLRLHKLWKVHYVMKGFAQTFEIIVVKIIVDIYFLIYRRINLVKILDFFVGLWSLSTNFCLRSLSTLYRSC